MMEAEKTFSTEEARVYIDYLVCEMEPEEFTVLAPSNKRAMAFIKTLEHLGLKKH